jgi:hypothetical protein
MLKAQEFPPEKSGFGIRTCCLNILKEQIEIKKGKHVENYIPISQLKGIILSNHARALIKYMITGNQPSLFGVPESDTLIKCKVVPIQLMLLKGAVDLIMPNFETYVNFTEAYEELLRIKNKIKPIVDYLKNKGEI